MSTRKQTRALPTSCTFVIYAADRQLSKHHHPVLIGDEVACWVRAEAKDEDVVPALDAAKPRRGETTLNAVDFTAP